MVRINGTDVGLLAKTPVLSVGDGEATTLTLVLIPSSVEVKGEHARADKPQLGFTAG
ncbi:hypothetical protein [Streptomyces zaomyceticus]|uniref:hypothetical protein n=1 Tax=Streptomyces zaomyceticus TaxID=68286 RepID=UPI0034495AD8